MNKEEFISLNDTFKWKLFRQMILKDMVDELSRVAPKAIKVVMCYDISLVHSDTDAKNILKY